MKTRILTVAIAAILAISSGAYAKKAAQPQPQAVDAAQVKALDSAKAKYSSGDFAAARIEAAKLIETHPGSPLSADAQYLIAKSHLGEGNEQAAREELDRFIKNYPNHANTAEAAATLRSLEAKRFQEIIDSQRREETALEEQNRKLNSAIDGMKAISKTDKIYIVIDIEHDMVMVKMGAATLYSFPCVTGKGAAYLAAIGEATSFETPRGKLKILKKETDPVWIRPNWYWLERGEEVPEGITREQRAVRGHLGKYKMDLGEGFYIHGYSGKVKPGKYSHGCIRLNGDDLELLYNITEVGTEVYLF